MNTFLVLMGIAIAVAVLFVLIPQLRQEFNRIVLVFWNYVSNKTEYVELPAYLSDEVSKSNIAVFAKRAQRWKRVAEFSFFFAITSVVVGVAIFIFADRIAFNDPELARITVQRDELQKKLDETFAAGGDRRRQSFSVPELNQSWTTLHTYVRNLPAILVENPQDDELGTVTTWLVRCSGDRKKNLRVLGTLVLGPDSQNPGKFTESELVTLRNHLQEFDLDGSVFHSYIERLFALAGKVKATAKLDEAGKIELSKLRTLANDLNAKSEKVQEILTDWNDEVKTMYGVALQTETVEVLGLQSRISSYNEQIMELRAKFNPNNAYSVIPLMVVRLGAVILLIFLTQILLAVYRYNTSLSTYYDSIADALRMVGPDEDGVGPSQKELLELIKNLNPKDYAYFLPESPINQIRDLASRGN